jgi:hypothetical protein
VVKGQHVVDDIKELGEENTGNPFKRVVIDECGQLEDIVETIAPPPPPLKPKKAKPPKPKEEPPKPSKTEPPKAKSKTSKAKVTPPKTKAKKGPRCGICRQVGHNRRACPENPKNTKSKPIVQFFTSYFCPYAQMAWIALNLKGGSMNNLEVIEGLTMKGPEYIVHP